MRATAMSCAWALGATLALATAPPPARAIERPAGAGALHDKALAAMKAGRFAEAAELFRGAFELDPAPELLWNEARARHQAGELERARELYKTFIERNDAPPELRGKANDSIVEISLELERRSKPPAPPSPVAPTPDSDTTAGWVLVGTGGVLAIGGLVAHLMSFDAADDMEAYATPSPDLSEDLRRDRYDSAESAKATSELLAGLGYGLGGAALTVGVILVATADGDTSDVVAITPWLAPRAAGVEVALRF